MANILVTGGAGYVGSACCSELLGAHSVTVVDNLCTGFRHNVPPAAKFVQADIGDRNALESLLRANQFDVIFHFAARALVAESAANPGFYFEENVASGIALLETLRGANIKKFIFSSSAAVYGTPTRVPILEDDPKKPVNPYGETKLIFENILRWYTECYDWSVVAFRYFNAAGATPDLGEQHDPETHLIPLVLQAVAGEREFVNIYGTDYKTPDGTCLRDYVHVLDIARAHISALPKLGPAGMRSYNIGTGTPYSVRQVCDAVEKVVGRRVPVRLAARRPGDPDVLYADSQRIKAELGWIPRDSSLEGIIASAWQWRQRHPARPAAVST